MSYLIQGSGHPLNLTDLIIYYSITRLVHRLAKYQSERQVACMDFKLNCSQSQGHVVERSDIICRYRRADLACLCPVAENRFNILDNDIKCKLQSHKCSASMRPSKISAHFITLQPKTGSPTPDTEILLHSFNYLIQPLQTTFDTVTA